MSGEALETRTKDLSMTWSEREIAFSHAVSAKRQADALEKIATALDNLATNELTVSVPELGDVRDGLREAVRRK